jgi:hypothetical protein
MSYHEINGLGYTNKPISLHNDEPCYPLDPVAWGLYWIALTPAQKKAWYALTPEEKSALERLDGSELAAALTPKNPWTAPLPPTITTINIAPHKENIHGQA